MSTAADNRFYREVPGAAVDDGGPAHPVEVGTRPVGQNWHQTGPNAAQHYGMSLRDYFAAKVLQGYFANMPALSAARQCAKDEGVTFDQFIAVAAYEAADAMLEARQA